MHLGECPWEEDWAYASQVCQQAGVPLEAISLQKEYWDQVGSGIYEGWLSMITWPFLTPLDRFCQVVSYTIEEARAGRTPNPDIMCNSRVKFGVFYDQIGKHFPLVATGHYAQTVRSEDPKAPGL